MAGRRRAARWLAALLGRGSVFRGDYPSWEDALAECHGYHMPEILEAVLRATRAVESGRAAMERDGVTFAEPEHPWPLLAGLARQAARDAGRLAVLDFGGALGSTYRQCRVFLNAERGAPAGVRPRLRWAVVEQPHFVEAGRKEFQTAELTFHGSPDEAAAAAAANALLLSSVLPYLPHPWETLERLLALRAWPCVIVDRTPVWDAEDRLTVQHVPASIYGRPVRYPAWFFNRERLQAALERVGPTFTFPGRDGCVGVGGREAAYVGMMAFR